MEAQEAKDRRLDAETVDDAGIEMEAVEDERRV
jgi:hypothetical protein